MINAATALSRTAATASAQWFVGISRHGVVAAERLTHDPQNRNGFRQVMSQLAGSMLIGLGVSLFVHAQLGVPAFDVMLTALRDQLGISLGQAGWLFTGSLFLMASLLGHRPGPSGLFYLLANGISVDIWLHLIRDPEPLALRMLFVLLGTLAIAGGVALVVHAGLTGGALELLMHAGVDRGFDPFRTRQALDLLIVAAGVALGGDLGVATLFYVLTMSPALKAGRQALADHRDGRARRLAAVS